MEINKINEVDDFENVETEVEEAKESFKKTHRLNVEKLHELQEGSRRIHAGEACTNVTKAFAF